MPNIVQIVRIAEKIHLIRGAKVMLDRDLATLYGVENRVLKQAVRRNKKRFPKDFMFELTKTEFENLRSQIVISSWGGLRYAPMAFTEQGVAMLSSVLHSNRAIQVNIQIMRVFIKLRQMSISQEELKQKIIAMEGKSDKQFQIIFEAIQQLLEEDEKPKRKIGYVKAPKNRFRQKERNNSFAVNYAAPANPKKILRI